MGTFYFSWPPKLLIFFQDDNDQNDDTNEGDNENEQDNDENDEEGDNNDDDDDSSWEDIEVVEEIGGGESPWEESRAAKIKELL